MQICLACVCVFRIPSRSQFTALKVLQHPIWNETITYLKHLATKWKIRNKFVQILAFAYTHAHPNGQVQVYVTWSLMFYLQNVFNVFFHSNHQAIFILFCFVLFVSLFFLSGVDSRNSNIIVPMPNDGLFHSFS